MKRFDGIISRDYDFVPPSIPGYFELQNRLAELVADEYPNARLIDVGLGTGITTQALLAKNPGCSVLGVDSEPIMIEHATRNLASEIAAGRVTVHQADAFAFLKELDGESIDVVASAFTIHNCPRRYRTKLQAAVFTALRRGGLFINCDKYAADHRREYVREVTDQILRFDVLSDFGRDDLRRKWIEHEMVDQLPGRIMWTRETLSEYRSMGFADVSLLQRIGQYAIVSAYKPGIRCCQANFLSPLAPPE